ncbi:MAG: hypothetical protein AAF869_06000, partial [Pseudomonadota bacterium]
VEGAMEDDGPLRRAVAGVRSVLLVSGDAPQMARREIRVLKAIEATTKTGDGPLVVKISAITAGLPGRPSFGRLHGLVEDALEASSLGYTILRPTFFHQSLSLMAGPMRRGVLPAATGAGAVGFVDLADVSDCAAAALLTEGRGRTIDVLTGPEQLTMAEAANQLSELTARPVRHVSPPSAVMPYLLWFGAGLSPWLARKVAELMACIKTGGEAVTTDSVERWLGRPPRPLAAYLPDLAAQLANS